MNIKGIKDKKMAQYCVIATLLLMTACESAESTRQASIASKVVVDSKLQEGCHIYEAGQYKTQDGWNLPIVYVTCGDLTTVNSSYQYGKTRQHFAVAHIQELQDVISKSEEEKHKLEAALNKLSEEDKAALGIK